ncbi:phosphotransferase family protein [Lacrimispora sp. 210928-DFI.3.58]|uniref:phosphotransferase family protein n=1 Tax=Lacrimispora sp. 210928-DFI.3.58 TaxID=2883214 RepID=UPI001D0802EC|nr:hypothetical protein [Lacrimispora sp. 210928-DFI.3.58]MCB7320086.1 hypothetical protein [Lacrimispora sp. 210928-DFI.3.58]
MKISEMLKRENFYEINRKTLSSFYADGTETTKLYIYPKLNAIVSQKPSSNVKGYLLCEYSVRSNIFKKIIVLMYVNLCMLSRGILSDRAIEVRGKINNDILIYPCNKKYRIFDFKKQTVDVIIKDGFCASDLRHEIEFRGKDSLPSFVPRLLSFSEKGYKEIIIDGRPLARIGDGFQKYRDMAYNQLCAYMASQADVIDSKTYVRKLKRKTEELATDKVKDKECLQKIISTFEKIKIEDEIPISFSHGDLQAGNIWVENKTEKVFIIDWESWGVRSCWYDKAVLYDNLRPGGLDAYFKNKIDITERVVVLFEDLIFQLTELNNLPGNFGEEQFEKYLLQLNKYIERMGT